MPLILPHRFRRQPEGPVEIDWTHPITKGLTGFWIFNEALPFNLVTGERSSLTSGSFSPGASRHGRHIVHGSVADVLQLAANWETLLDEREGSILVHSIPPEGSAFANHRPIGTIAPSSGDNNNFHLLFASGNLYFDYNIRAANTSGGTRLGPLSGVSSGGVILGTRDARAGVTPRGSAAYLDGRLLSTTTSGTQTSTGVDAPFGIAYNSAGNATQVGARTFAAATWIRGLLPAEAASISRNPYQILRPQARRVYFFVPQPPVSSGEIDLPLLVTDATLAAGALVEADIALPLLDVTCVVYEEGANFALLDLPVLAVDAEGFITQFADAALSLPALSTYGTLGELPYASSSITLPSWQVSGTASVQPGGYVELPALTVSGVLIGGRDLTGDVLLPALRVAADVYVSSLEDVHLSLPVLRAQGEIAHGNVLDASVQLPSLECQGGSAAVSSVSIPALQVSAQAQAGQTLRAEISLPALSAQSEASNPAIITASVALPSLLAQGTSASGARAVAALSLPSPSASAMALCGTVAESFSLLPALQAGAELLVGAAGALHEVLPALVVDAFIRVPLQERIDAYAMNTEALAVSRYPEYPILAAVRMGDVYLAAGPDGLFVLTGDQDDGDQINARLRTGLSDLGSDALKRVVDVYVGGRTRGALSVSVRTDGEDAEHTQPAGWVSPDGVKTARVKLGRGTKSRYWQFEIANIDGADFELDTLAADEMATARRVS